MAAELTIEKLRQAKKIFDEAECKAEMISCPHCWSGRIYEFHIFDRYTGDYYLHLEISDCPVCWGYGYLNA